MTTAEIKAIPIEEVDFTDKESIIKCFPRYVREQFALARVKGITQTVDISPFDMKAPFSSNYLLKDTKLLLEPNKRHCLIGEAGTGKSTLFENMAKGTIKDFPMHLHVHHCQEIELHGHESDSFSVLQTVVRAHTYRNNLLDCDREVKKRIAACDAEKDKDLLVKLKENAEFIFFQLSKVNSNTAEDRASKMLRVLGFDDTAQLRPISALSGGLRMRVALCAAFFIEADLLLLDEPTNHLDFPSVLWLENRLRGYSKSFILICHDRELLNNVCTSCILLDCGKIVYYSCGFKEFESRRAKEDKKYSEEIDKFMMRNRNVDFSSPAAKEKAEKQKWLETYNARQILLAGKFTFPAATPLKPAAGETEGKISLINVENVRFSYQEGKLPYIFDTPISFNVTTSTRIGIMGPNGAGKSTFLKLITDKLTPCSGSITRHKTAVVAYFAQHHVLELNLEQTPSEFMRIQFPHVKNDGYLRKHLQKVGIAGAAADTRMKQLSAGQRSCIMFAKITYECPHLLIMDEPTNFLDLDSVDALIAASNSFTGALLLVSHNRGFLQKCARQYLSIVPGQFLLFDELKACEKATYTFIQELEAGMGGGKIGQNALVKKTAAAPGAAGVIGAKPTGPIVLSGGSRLPPPVTIKKKVVEEPVAATGRGGRGGARGGRGGAPQRGGARGGRGRGGP